MSRGSFHTHEMLPDAFTDIGPAGFRIDAQIMAVVLLDYAAEVGASVH